MGGDRPDRTYVPFKLLACFKATLPLAWNASWVCWSQRCSFVSKPGEGSSITTSKHLVSFPRESDLDKSGQIINYTRVVRSNLVISVVKSQLLRSWNYQNRKQLFPNKFFLILKTSVLAELNNLTKWNNMSPTWIFPETKKGSHFPGTDRIPENVFFWTLNSETGAYH